MANAVIYHICVILLTGVDQIFFFKFACLEGFLSVMIIILILLREIVEVWRANVHYVDCRVYPLTHCSNIKAKEVSSQMLLLCAWRSVKELSLFLGDLCSRDSSATGYNWNLLSTDLEVSRALVIVIYFPAYYTF